MQSMTLAWIYLTISPTFISRFNNLLTPTRAWRAGVPGMQNVAWNLMELVANRMLV